MRKLASIKEIGTILPIENADAIELAMIDGWQCVVAKKDNFKPGNKIVYIEIDSIVPERPEFEFLRDRKFRVKTIKLRGQISQGLVLPLSILPDRKKPYEIGEDVTEILGIKKYDPQAEQEKKLIVHKKQNKFQKFMMHFKWYRKLVLKKESTAPFPEDIHKTDEERIQNLSKPFEQWKKQGIKFQGTEKIEGQSGTFFTTKLDKKRLFGVCSRNIWLKAKDKSSYWQIAETKNFNNMLEDIAARFNATKIVLQGEIVGPNIQKNIYHLDDYDIYVFNLIIDDKPLPTFKIKQIMDEYGIHTVPIIYDYQKLPETIAEVIEMSKGISQLREGQKREGIVWRSEDCKISFKAINPEYLLSQEVN